MYASIKARVKECEKNEERGFSENIPVRRAPNLQVIKSIKVSDRPMDASGAIYRFVADVMDNSQ